MTCSVVDRAGLRPRSLTSVDHLHLAIARPNSHTMTNPHLPDDVLSEVLSHLFTIDVDATPPTEKTWRRETRPRGPTAIGQSEGLLRVSKRFHSLVEPFIWRTVILESPPDFSVFFAPKTGLLHVAGEPGDRRRGWVRELVLGQDAAIPSDKNKIAYAVDVRGDFYQDSFDLDLHADILSAKLPNLKRLQIGHTRELGPAGVKSDPALNHLHKVINDLQWSVTYDDGEQFTLGPVRSYDWLWQSLRRRNDELLAAFLAPFVHTLAVFRAPLLSTTRTYVRPSNWTLLDRLPVKLKEAPTNVVVVLDAAEPPDDWPLPTDRGLPKVDELRALVERLPDGVKVEIYRAKWMEGRGWRRELTEEEKKDDKPGEWVHWCWLDEGGDRSTFTYDSLRVSHPGDASTSLTYISIY